MTNPIAQQGIRDQLDRGHPAIDRIRKANAELRAALAPSAPATASEGATTSATDGADHHDGERSDDSPEHGERSDDEPGQHGGTLTAAAGEGATEWRDGELADYLAAMEQAGGGIYTADFCGGFRHALEMVAACESDARRRAATGVTSSDGDRGLSEEERATNTALSVWASTCHAYCSEEDRVHTRECLLAAGLHRIIAARTAQPEGNERVEWGVRIATDQRADSESVAAMFADEVGQCIACGKQIGKEGGDE